MTIRREGNFDGFATPAEIRSVWDEYADIVAEPFRSALSSLPRDAHIWRERLSQWPTVAWEENQGPVTLAGDAAHPMTYRKIITLQIAPHLAFFRRLSPNLEMRFTLAKSHAQIVVRVLITPYMMPAIFVERSKSIFMTGSGFQMSWQLMRLSL